MKGKCIQQCHPRCLRCIF